MDRNFRIESNNNANLFFLDAGLARIGVGTTTPDNMLDVFGKISLTQSAGDEMVIINDDVWQHGSGNHGFGTGGAHFIMASRETDYESAGVYGDGNVITLWSPGDANNGQPSALIYVCDEDRYDAVTDNNPHNNNSVYAYLNTAGNWVAASDRNRKENIVPLTSSLEKVVQIQSYQYNFKQTEGEIQKGSPAPHSLGVIAQEVEKIIPEVVEKSADGDYYVSYIEFIPVLLEAVKEQNALVEAQKSESGIGEWHLRCCRNAGCGEPYLEQANVLNEAKVELEQVQELVPGHYFLRASSDNGLDFVRQFTKAKN